VLPRSRLSLTTGDEMNVAPTQDGSGCVTGRERASLWTLRILWIGALVFTVVIWPPMGDRYAWQSRVVTLLAAANGVFLDRTIRSTVRRRSRKRQGRPSAPPRARTPPTTAC